MTVTIRHAGPGDELAVVELVREFALAVNGSSPIDERYVRRYLASPDATILLATDERETIGLLSYTVRPRLLKAGESAEVEVLVVAPQWRGQGIGRRLLRTSMRLMQEAGCLTAAVNVPPDNEGFQDLYFDAGFIDASVRLERLLPHA